jgi:hypothetical protein
MKSRVVLMGLGLAILLGQPAFAVVNCAQVMKNLSTGRSPDVVADTMGITLEEVQGCQAQADEKKEGKEKAGQEKKEEGK